MTSPGYENFITVRTFAEKCGVTTRYVHFLESEGKINYTNIDGVHFIDKTKYADLILKIKKNGAVRGIKKLLNATKNEQ